MISDFTGRNKINSCSNDGICDQLHGAVSSDKQLGRYSNDEQFLEQSAPWSRDKMNSFSNDGICDQLHGAVSSDEQFGRYSNNGILNTEVCNFKGLAFHT